MRIIGIDPGLTRCGVGVVTAGPGRAVTFEHVEVLKSPADASTPSRLLQIGSSIARMLDGQEIGAIALRFNAGAVVFWSVLLLALGLLSALASARRVLAWPCSARAWPLPIRTRVWVIRMRLGRLAVPGSR